MLPLLPRHRLTSSPPPSLGLRTSLSVKYAQGDLAIVDSYSMGSIKTRDAKAIADTHGWRSTLLVHG